LESELASLSLLALALALALVLALALALVLALALKSPWLLVLLQLLVTPEFWLLCSYMVRC
jgi:hypothetical protein